MIHVDVTVRNGRILRMRIAGHADSGPYGSDLVCAEVSAIGTGLCNAIDEYSAETEMQLEEGLIEINAENDDSHDLQVILNTGFIQLKTVQVTNSKFIKIKLMEV